MSDCWRRPDFCAAIAPFERRITELEAALAERDRRVAELEDALERMMASRGAKGPSATTCGLELPQRAQDGDGLLTQDEVDDLPAGAVIEVTWSGGNGPHQYTVAVQCGLRYAVDQHGVWVAPLDLCGQKPQTTVRLVSTKRPQDGDDDTTKGKDDEGGP